MVVHRCNKEAEIATLLADVRYIRETMKAFLPDHKRNNAFRQQAKGIIGGIAFFCTCFGAITFFVLEKIVGGN